jgi:hypothetical protein
MGSKAILEIFATLGFHESHQIDQVDTQLWVKTFSQWITVDKSKLQHILDRICLHEITSLSINTDFLCIWGDVDLLIKFDWCTPLRKQQLKRALSLLLQESTHLFGLSSQSVFDPASCSVSIPSKKVVRQIESTNWRISFLRAFLWVVSHLTLCNPSLKVMLHQSLLRSLHAVLSDSRWETCSSAPTSTIEECVATLVSRMQQRADTFK